jgi:hypothetical protein
MTGSHQQLKQSTRTVRQKSGIIGIPSGYRQGQGYSTGITVPVLGQGNEYIHKILLCTVRLADSASRKLNASTADTAQHTWQVWSPQGPVPTAHGLTKDRLTIGVTDNLSHRLTKSRLTIGDQARTNFLS